MNKAELSSHVAAEISMPGAAADRVVSAVFAAVAEALARGDTVSIAGFGSFTTRTRAAPPGPQPRYRGKYRHRRFEGAGVQGREGAQRGCQRPDMTHTAAPVDTGDLALNLVPNAGTGTFVVSTRRREFRDSSLMRTPARLRAALESPRARVPHVPGCELPPGTRLRAGAHVKYPTRYPPAYAHSRPNDGTPFSYVGAEVHRAMHRPITRTRIPARRGRRIPAESQSAPSLQSLHGILIAIVSRPHASSIIALWQGSGRRSVSGQPLRHDGDRKTE